MLAVSAHGDDAGQDSEYGYVSKPRADVCGYGVLHFRLFCEQVRLRWHARGGDEDRADVRVRAPFLRDYGCVHAAH